MYIILLRLRYMELGVSQRGCRTEYWHRIVSTAPALKLHGYLKLKHGALRLGCITISVRRQIS